MALVLLVARDSLPFNRRSVLPIPHNGQPSIHSSSVLPSAAFIPLPTYYLIHIHNNKFPSHYISTLSTTLTSSFRTNPFKPNQTTRGRYKCPKAAFSQSLLAFNIRALWNTPKYTTQKLLEGPLSISRWGTNFILHHVFLKKKIYIYMLSLYSACLSKICRVSQEECARLQEGVPYVKVYRYNPKNLCPNLNGYGDNGQRSLKVWQLLHTYWLPNTY